LLAFNVATVLVSKREHSADIETGVSFRSQAAIAVSTIIEVIALAR